MRPSHIFLVLILFIAPQGTRAQGSTSSTSLDEPCSVSADPRWTPQEKFVWERVCDGKVADFNAAPGYGGELDPKKPDSWPQNRILRPAFLETILLTGTYRRALTRHGVDIVGARFIEDLDLQNAELGHYLGLRNSLLEKGLNFARARSKFPMSLTGSNMAGAVNLWGLELGAELFMEDAKFTNVHLQFAHVGTLSLSGSKGSGELEMMGLHVDHFLLMDKPEFAAVVLIGARVGATLHLKGSKVSGRLQMAGLHVGQNLFMDEDVITGAKAEFNEVVLMNTQVGGALHLSGSVSRLVHMSGLQVGEDLLMDDAKSDLVLLSGARVGGRLHLTASKVKTLAIIGLQVGQDLDMGDKAEFDNVAVIDSHVGGALNVQNARVAGEFGCRGSEIEKQVSMTGAKFDGRIDCETAKIKGDLDLDRAQFTKNVDLSGAQIGGALRLGSTQWSEGTTLVLRNAKVGIIPPLADAWGPKLDLDGFTYQSAAAADQFHGWFARLDRYAPQPYEQLAAVVQHQGDNTLATTIRFAGRERERREARGLTWAWLTALKWTIGYGYHPELSVLWALGLVVVGAIVLRVSGEGPRNGMPYGLAYSFDVLLPIIRLRDKHYAIDLGTWARYYFYAHRIMGFLLASFLGAGLAGLTK
jgi:hypothetical protein